MKELKQLTGTIAILLLMAGCGNSKKDSNSIITEKRTTLAKLKEDKVKTEAEIKKLEEELEKLDTSATNTSKIRLVSISPVGVQNFQHYIELKGQVDAENISYISPRGAPGQVRALYIKAGQPVRKGQLLLRMDDAIMRQQVTASRQSLAGIRTQLSFAKNLYQRQKNLWDQGIGTEVQLITAKTNVESLENQLRSGNEQVKLAVEQLNTANVYSDVNGIADVVNVKVGETFTGMTAMGPQIKIVNTSSLKVMANVPENYISRMKTGTPVVINVPDLNMTLNSTLSRISQSIDITQRGFIAEAKIPYNAVLKPNQTAMMKILDYQAADAIVIPVNVIQTDETGKYVYVLQKLSNGKSVAKKKQINIGEVSGDIAEVKTGLASGELLITDGYQNLYEGQLVGTNVN